MTDEPKRKGRPPKPEADRKDGNLTFRTRAGLRERLAEAAAISGRSISEEVELRVERSFASEDAARAIRETIRQEMRAEFEARRTANFGQFSIADDSAGPYREMLARLNPLNYGSKTTSCLTPLEYLKSQNKTSET